MQRKLWSFLVFLMVLPTAAISGGTTTFEAGDASMDLAWKDQDTLRMGGQDAEAYMIVRDGKAYSVSMVGGQPRVMDVGAMLKMMGGMAGRSQQESQGFGRLDSIERTGASETVAGIEGRVYRMTTTANGKTETVEAVLTDDPLVVEMTRAYLGAMRTAFGVEGMDQFIEGLPDEDRGMLRAGDDFRVLSISGDDPAAGLFELPAEPMDLRQMMGGMKR